jgi:hypothetical protein
MLYMSGGLDRSSACSAALAVRKGEFRRSSGGDNGGRWGGASNIDGVLEMGTRETF